MDKVASNTSTQGRRKEKEKDQEAKQHEEVEGKTAQHHRPLNQTKEKQRRKATVHKVASNIVHKKEAKKKRKNEKQHEEVKGKTAQHHRPLNQTKEKQRRRKEGKGEGRRANNSNIQEEAKEKRRNEKRNSIVK